MTRPAIGWDVHPVRRMISHRENNPHGRSRNPDGRLRRSRPRARVELERLEPRVLPSGATKHPVTLDFADRPPTGAWIESVPPRDLLGLPPEVLAVSRDVMSSMVYEVRR